MPIRIRLRDIGCTTGGEETKLEFEITKRRIVGPNNVGIGADHSKPIDLVANYVSILERIK
jgi:hypothetical protein